MTTDVFLKPKDYYTRNIDPVTQYIEQSAFYLAMMTGDPFEKCYRFVSDGIQKNLFPKLRNPMVTFFERGMNGDREIKKASITDYIKDTLACNQILAPSMTTYLHPSIKPSLITKFTDTNVKKRGIAKKEQFKAKAAKENLKFVFKKNEQTYYKLNNNSLSGAFVAKGSFVNNPSAHSTLTSTTRTGTSFANAANEKFIMGNRHYRSPDIVLNNIISIVYKSNYQEIECVMEKYQLVYPSISDVLDCITYSSDLYWKDTLATERIARFVQQLTPIQRAAFVYTGDFYHIRKHNDQFVRKFIRLHSQKVTTPVENPLEKIHQFDEYVVIHAHHICSAEVKGFGKDYERMQEAGVLSTLVATAQSVTDAVYDYKDFIQAFFTTINVPASVAYIRDMVRRCVVISDTDSTCFSVDDWVKWQRGEIIFDSDSLAVSSVIAYYATQTFMHTMAVYSANINVAKDKLHTLAYKSEWTWTVVVPMNVAKHYFADAIVQEGNVFDEPELELKGVHLKSSNAPPSIIKDAKAQINNILSIITSNQKYSIKTYIKHVADKERYITTSLLEGKLEFYRLSKIKEKEAYSREAHESPYQHHTLWKNVFAPKYGEIEEPTYATVKIPTILANATKIKEWLDRMEDQAFAQRMGGWFYANKKTSFNTFYISINYLKSYGMPEELKAIIDTRRILLDLCNIYYLVGESLNFYKKEGMTLIELGY